MSRFLALNWLPARPADPRSAGDRLVAEGGEAQRREVLESLVYTVVEHVIGGTLTQQHPSPTTAATQFRLVLHTQLGVQWPAPPCGAARAAGFLWRRA